MIFLTVGSHEPFDRLVEAVDQWCAAAKTDEVFGQITDKGSYRPRNFEWVPYLDVQKYSETCARAEFLIAHAGMGSIITALDCTKPIVIMPRRGSLRETRNDHQFSTARQFQGKPGIFVAEDETAVAVAIDNARQSINRPDAEPNSPFAQARLIEFLSGLFEK